MTNSENIVLIARLKVKKGTEAEAKKAALAIIEDSRAEAGCLNYDMHEVIDDPTIFVWHETWADKSALEAHGNSSHFKEFSAKVKDMTEEPLQLTFTKMVSQKA